MEKVDVYEVYAYSWECPKCGTQNLTDKYCDLICCECDEEFEVRKNI